jgi:copper chaperone
MISFQVNDMTCGHCVSTITKAVRAVDQGAKVEIDLAAHSVQIEPTEADAGELADAIKEAGYTPIAVAGAAPQAEEAAQRGGCCCG